MITGTVKAIMKTLKTSDKISKIPVFNNDALGSSRRS